jgi:hypothetical protein
LCATALPPRSLATVFKAIEKSNQSSWASVAAKRTKMKRSIQANSIDCSKSRTAEVVQGDLNGSGSPSASRNGEVNLNLMDTRSDEADAQARALQSILALGDREIEQGRYRAVDIVFAELDTAYD